MGAPNDETAVVDPEFRVRGVDGLRIVDASVFPRIPGLFIALPLHILAERASETILAARTEAREAS
jgi:choline dehydrogenase